MKKYINVEVYTNHTFVNLETMYDKYTFKRNKKEEVVNSILFFLKRKLKEYLENKYKNQDKYFLECFEESLAFFNKYVCFDTRNFEISLNMSNINFIKKDFFKEFEEEWFLSLNPLFYDLKKEGLTKGEETRLNKMLVALFMKREEVKRSNKNNLKFYEKLFALDYTNYKYYVLHGALGNGTYLQGGTLVPSNNIKAKKIIGEFENYIDQYITKENLFSVLTEKTILTEVDKSIERLKDYLHYYEKETMPKFNYLENLDLYLNDCLSKFNKAEFIKFVKDRNRW